MPTLPGQGLTPKIFDTATQKCQAAPGGGIYVCGITPYDATHLGHAATYVAYDTLVRVWKDAGHEVTYVQNVTDIDDPLLERAAATGVDWQQLATSQTDLFRSDMEALSVIPPTHYLGVVESMELIIAGVQEMLAAGAAYWVGTDIYADLSKDSQFGEIANLDTETQLAYFAERGGDPETPGKRNPLDPLLWRGRREGEPAWDGAVLGHGRPGWHIECAIIARQYLQVPFVLQGGGQDLVFPHHEMSVSHLRLLTGETQPVRINMHAALISYQGEKMSKSLGNLIFVSKLREQGVAADAIRILLLMNHYSSEWEYTEQLLFAAGERLNAWQAQMLSPSPRAEGVTGAETLAVMRERLADNLDTGGALDAIDQWMDSGRQGEEDRRIVADAASALLGITSIGA